MRCRDFSLVYTEDHFNLKHVLRAELAILERQIDSVWMVLQSNKERWDPDSIPEDVMEMLCCDYDKEDVECSPIECTRDMLDVLNALADNCSYKLGEARA